MNSQNERTSGFTASTCTSSSPESPSGSEPSSKPRPGITPFRQALIEAAEVAEDPTIAQAALEAARKLF